MGFLSGDKDEYLDKLQAKDFKDLLWLPIAFILDLYVQFKIAPINEYRSGSFHLIIGGTAFILSSKGLSILFNMRWIMSPFRKRPFDIMTPFRTRLIGAGLIGIGVLVFFLK